MDRSVPAPSSGEKLQLVPIQKLLSKDAVSLYQAMMNFSAQHIEKRGEIQNLLWGLRHAAAPTRRYRNSMPIKFRFSTNESMPDGASLYSALRSQIARISKDWEAKKRMFKTALAKV